MMNIFLTTENRKDWLTMRGLLRIKIIKAAIDCTSSATFALNAAP